MIQRPCFLPPSRLRILSSCSSERSRFIVMDDTLVFCIISSMVIVSFFCIKDNITFCLSDNSFVCSIYDKKSRDYVGYCSVKSLVKDDWELAIELLPDEKNYLNIGFGYSYIKANSLNRYQSDIIIATLQRDFISVIRSCKALIKSEF